MKALASLIMRSRTHATLAVIVFSALTLFIPIFSVFCAPAIGLLVLRKGIYEGVIVLFLANGLLIMAGALSGMAHIIVPLVTYLSVMSAITIGVAWVLRQSRSLSLSLMSAGLVGIVFVLGIHLFLDDPVSYWRTILDSRFAPVLKEVSDTATQTAIINSLELMSKNGTSWVVNGILTSTIISLFIARWWQASLYNPGGFGEEFRQLRFPKTLSIATLGVAVFGIVDLGSISVLGYELLSIFLTLYTLQGLSIAHAIVSTNKLHGVWLAPVYFLAMFLSQIVAVAGYIDTWADFRQRFGRAVP